MEDSNSSGSSYWDSNDEDETNLPSPIDMTDLMKGQDDTEVSIVKSLLIIIFNHGGIYFFLNLGFR